MYVRGRERRSAKFFSRSFRNNKLDDVIIARCDPIVAPFVSSRLVILITARITPRVLVSPERARVLCRRDSRVLTARGPSRLRERSQRNGRSETTLLSTVRRSFGAPCPGPLSRRVISPPSARLVDEAEYRRALSEEIRETRLAASRGTPAWRVTGRVVVAAAWRGARRDETILGWREEEEGGGGLCVRW